MTEGNGGVWWGWMIPLSKVGGQFIHNWARRAWLRRHLENGRFPDGRTLEALRRAAGEAETDEGRERTRALLHGVRRGSKRARILKRSDPNAPEMWGLREG
jgi:hypothetical protein